MGNGGGGGGGAPPPSSAAQGAQPPPRAPAVAAAPTRPAPSRPLPAPAPRLLGGAGCPEPNRAHSRLSRGGGRCLACEARARQEPLPPPWPDAASDRSGGNSRTAACKRGKGVPRALPALVLAAVAAAESHQTAPAAHPTLEPTWGILRTKMATKNRTLPPFNPMKHFTFSAAFCCFSALAALLLAVCYCCCCCCSVAASCCPTAGLRLSLLFSSWLLLLIC